MIMNLFNIKRNRNKKQMAGWPKYFILAALFCFVSVPGVHAKDVLNETFEVLRPEIESGLVEGRDGAGWTQPESDFIMAIPAYIDYEADFTGSERGIITFDIQRRSEGDDGSARSIFSLQDQQGNSLLLMQIQWSSDFDPTKPMITLSHEYLRSSIGLWGPQILLDQQVLPRQWIHVDLVWDDGKKIYQLFVDGRPQDVEAKIYDSRTRRIYSDTREETMQAELLRGEVPTYSARPFSYILDRVSLVRLGVNYYTGKRVATSPLSNAVLDNFRICIGDVAHIYSVTHNASSVAGFSGKLVEGDKVKFILKAEPGGRASIDIEDRIAGIPLTESPEKPGTYTGSYNVGFGDHIEDGKVYGRLADEFGFVADPKEAARTIDIDARVFMDVKSSNDLIPADRSSRAGITVVASDANGAPVRKHPLNLTMSTTDEYTGMVGGGTFEELVGGEMDVNWGGVTDSFGEVTAQYLSGFAAKTILVSTKDMVSGDVGVGYVRSYITGTVDVLVKEPRATALSLSGSMEVSLSRDWLTADGRSRSRITAVIKDQDGNPVSGNQIRFALLGENGSLQEVRSRTDSRGRAFADYIAGTVIGQVQVEVRDMTGGHVALVSIELRSDAPAEIALTAEPGEVLTDDKTGSVITAKVTDANGNPNFNTDVLFEVASGGGSMSAGAAVTDEKDGIASVNFLPGSEPGVSTVKATVMSRAPTADEVAAAEGAVFLYGLDEDPGRLEVAEWFAEPGDEVVEGQDLVKLEDRSGTFYTVVSPRDGTVSTFTAEEEDRVEYGQTLGYVLPVPE